MRLDNVTIIWDGTEVVRHLRQHYYFCNSIATVIFEAKRHATDLPGAITQSNAEDENCCSLNNVEQNVSARGTTSKDIAELYCQGILVDDDNEPAPENVWAPPPKQLNVGEWIVPSIRCCQANSTISGKEGKWNYFTWTKIGKMSEIKLFCMAFPEDFVISVILPAMNSHLMNHMTLQEFYVWLGCNFYGMLPRNLKPGRVVVNETNFCKRGGSFSTQPLHAEAPLPSNYWSDDLHE